VRVTRSEKRFEHLVIRLLIVLAVLLVVAIVYVVATWPGDGGIFGLAGLNHAR
jgi:hypothetical protein